jgi:uncharacterized membrane protein (UPF0127 family)
MHIHNITRDAPIATAAFVADRPWTRLRGLMMRGSLADGEALVLQGEASIHMMFMRFPIDAVFFDADGRVTKVKRGLRPWTGIAFGGRHAAGVIEMAAGAAAAVEPGDQLQWAA